MKQPKRTNKKVGAAAFSTMEIIATVVVIGVIAAIAMPIINNTTKASKESKLTNEVASINRAIQVYTSNGGSLEGITDPQQVIDQLKTTLSGDDAKRYVGMTGSMIDSRANCEFGNAGNGQLCAVYNSTTQQFELTKGASDCVLEFNLNGDGSGTTTQDRDASLVEYGDEGWIWEYDPEADSNSNNNNNGNNNVASNPVATTPVASPTNQNTFTETVGEGTNPNNPNNGGGVPNEPGLGPDGITSIQPCEAPQFLLPTGDYPKDQFPLSCPIINPNGENGEILYMIEGKDDSFKPYDSNFTCEAGDVVIAYCQGTSEFYTDSSQVTCIYNTDNDDPICEGDDITINIVYNTHYAANDSEGIDSGTGFGDNTESVFTNTVIDPLTNDSDPDGDDLEVCDITAESNQIPITATINAEGTITFVPSTEVGLLGFRRSIYFDQENYGSGEVLSSEVNESYNEFWEDIASVYNWKLSELGKSIENGSRQDENGTFTATNTYTYTACDNFGGEDSAEITCLVQELTVLSPIAIDTDGSGAIELTNNVQSFDFTGNGSNEQVKGWFASNDGILVDANYGDNISGQHLFGDMGGKHSDGFAKLSLRDEDKNGVIAGSEMANLKLWFDNGNAKLDDGELRSMDDFGINEISLKHSDYVSSATTKDGVKLHVEDIWFPVHK